MNKSLRKTMFITFLVATLAVEVAIGALENARYGYGRKNYGQKQEEADPEMMFAILARLGQTIIRANDVENSKRGLDLGLSRGYSGSQQAKHMMGIAAAGLSGGPGRRRRSDLYARYRVPQYFLDENQEGQK